MEKTATLVWSVKQLGRDYFRPCGDKVEDLRSVIANTSEPTELSKEFGELVVSVLIDGQDCSPYLIDLLGSDRPLPATNLPFRLRDLGVQDLMYSVKTEGELGGFMLDRLNPELRLTFGAAVSVADEYGDSYSNELLDDYWTASLGE